jgi:hypothetical protein
MIRRLIGLRGELCRRLSGWAARRGATRRAAGRTRARAPSSLAATTSAQEAGVLDRLDSWSSTPCAEDIAASAACRNARAGDFHGAGAPARYPSSWAGGRGVSHRCSTCRRSLNRRRARGGSVRRRGSGRGAPAAEPCSRPRGRPAGAGGGAAAALVARLFLDGVERGTRVPPRRPRGVAPRKPPATQPAAAVRRASVRVQGWHSQPGYPVGTRGRGPPAPAEGTRAEAWEGGVARDGLKPGAGGQDRHCRLRGGDHELRARDARTRRRKPQREHSRRGRTRAVERRGQRPRALDVKVGGASGTRSTEAPGGGRGDEYLIMSAHDGARCSASKEGGQTSWRPRRWVQ